MMYIVLSLPRLFAYLLLVGQCVAGQWAQIGGDIDGENEMDFAGGTQGALAMNGSGTTIAVGASGHDGGGEGAGHVRIFDLADGVWVQRGADIQGEFAGDGSGESVVMSKDGEVVGIGEPYSEAGHTGSFEKDFGQVRVFEWKDGSWVKRGQAIVGVDNYDFASSPGGLAMDACGSTVVIGAASHDGLDGQRQGHVRVFDWDGTNWVQRGNDMNGEAAGDWFGNSVAASASGNTVAVGALFNDVDAEAGSYGCVICRGSVRIFDWDANSAEWVQRGRDVDGEQDHDFSGSSLAMSDAGDVVAIGSPRTNAPYGDQERGSVTVYNWDGSDWQKRGTRIEGEADGDISGSTLAISTLGDTIAIGAYLNSGSSDTEGQVRVFDWDGNSWLQRGDDIDGENTYDYSGYSLAMSADGNKLASGARYTDDGAGYFAGHARVFGWMGDGSGCEDDEGSYNGKDCTWVAQSHVNRCALCDGNICAEDYCKQTCGTC